MFDDLVAKGVPEDQARIQANSFAHIQEINESSFKANEVTFKNIEINLSKIAKDMNWLIKIVLIGGGIIFSALGFLFTQHFIS